MVNLETKLENIQNGFGIAGSPEELEQKIPNMSNEDIIDILDCLSLFKMMLDEEEQIEYFQDVVQTKEKAQAAVKSDRKCYELLEKEVKKRNISF